MSDRSGGSVSLTPFTVTEDREPGPGGVVVDRRLAGEAVTALLPAPHRALSCADRGLAEGNVDPRPTGPSPFP